MGYFSQKDVECMDSDRSFPDEQALLKLRLLDLTDRYYEIEKDSTVADQYDHISDADLKHILPEHMTSRSVIERAINLTRYELLRKYSGFTEDPLLTGTCQTECKGQMKLIFNKEKAAYQAA